MSDSNEIPEEIVNKKKLGDKKFHSETSLQHYDEDSEGMEMPRDDPGVLNTSFNEATQDTIPGRRRTMSQPGPVAGSLMTASAARAARKRPLRSVAYADDNEQMPRVVLGRHDSGAATPIGERGSPTPNGTLKNGDIKSLNSYRIYSSVNELRGVGTPRRRSVTTMDAQSLRSVETHAPPPTSPAENKKLTQKYLTLVISCIYAIVLVSLGFIVYISNAVLRSNIATYFSIALCGIGMAYHIYLIIDIGRYKTNALKNQKTKSIHDEKIAAYFRQQEEEYNNNNSSNYNNNNSANYNNNNSANYNNNNSANYNNNNNANYNNNNNANYNNNSSVNTIIPGERTPNRFVPLPQPTLIPLKHEYCFSYGRHSGSFYLKMGAAGFAIGHLIHSVLLIAMQVIQLVDETVENDECVSIEQIVLDIMSPAYSFLQLYFIFKYSNVIIKKFPSLAFLAIMHIIGSSICFWLSAIVRETILALTLYANTVYGNSTTSDENTRFLDISGLYNQHCAGNTSYTSFMNISENFSPYLYPFSVEFNILIVAIYYIIWSQIGKCENDEDSQDSEVNTNSEENATVCRIPTAHEENDFTSNLVIHADCHASNRGMFLGMILIVIVAGMLIIGYIFSSIDGEYSRIGYLLNDCTMLAMHSVLLIAAVIAFNQTRRLDINEHPISLLDDVLLFICIPAFALEIVLSLVATISLTNVIKIVNYVVMALQVLVQTPLIMDGLRRCSNQKKLRRKKPGREVLMFLIIANVAMWLFYTFSYKSPESLDERYAYYGKILWSILGHISLPLIMFYRFHSSVCFADIWDSAYKPGSEH